MKKFSAGQSLVEVLVAVGAMSLLMVALLSLVALSMRNSRLAKDRTQAVALAQEGVELIRAYRDYSWTEIAAVSGVSNYDLPKNWIVEDGLSAACDLDNFTIYSFYRRCVQITPEDATTLEIVVTVDWQEGSREHQATQTTKLSLWER
ncbi:hypothetical protein ACFL18_02440 [Patescibacteria group bacterium]